MHLLLAGGDLGTLRHEAADQGEPQKDQELAMQVGEHRGLVVGLVGRLGGGHQLAVDTTQHRHRRRIRRREGVDEEVAGGR